MRLQQFAARMTVLALVCLATLAQAATPADIHGGGTVGAPAATPLGGSSASAGLPEASTLSGGLFGEVRLFKPLGPLRGFVVLYSDRNGWQLSDQSAADGLARAGAMVVGVDTPQYAAKLATQKEDPSGCHYLVGDAEAVSHQLQREAGATRYFLPIVAGTGAGALVAERTLGRAPSNTLGGAALLDADSNAQLDARFRPCAPDASIDRGDGLTGFLVAGTVHGKDLEAAIPTGGHPVTTRHFATGTTEGAALLDLIQPYLTSAVQKEDDISDLPLVALPSAAPSDMMAIVISGDGGWRDLDKTIAEQLQKQGVPVVGVDALRYFWSSKTPEQTTRDMVRILEVYGKRWHTEHVALIGYSFGADVMPFIYNRLPPVWQRRVSQVSLLGFAPKADFQIRVTGWLGMPASDKALAALPETMKLPPPLLQCFYGMDEDETACPDLAPLTKAGATLVKTDGGHHFGGNYDDLAKMILTRWKSRIAATASGAALVSKPAP